MVVLVRNHGLVANVHSKVTQCLEQTQLYLNPSESLADAISGTVAEGKVVHGMSRLGEPLGVEFFGIGVKFGVRLDAE